MTPSVTLSGYLGLRVKHLLAHELFHNWNGRRIRKEEPEGLVYWFSEGFTEFYTGRLLLRAGLISLRQYVELVNEDLEEYHTSPVREVPNQRIGDDFWKDPAVQRLPYRRGESLPLARAPRAAAVAHS